MTDTPILGAPDWASAQSSPWLTENKAKRMIEAMARHGSIKDRDLSSPPGSCADGDCYLVAATGSGAWLNHTGELAIAVGANAASGWYFVTVAKEGNQLWVEDENILIRYVDAAWVNALSTGQAFEFEVSASDETTALTAGEAKITFLWPADVTLSSVVGFLTGAADSSGPVEFDVNKDGVSIFSTLPQIDPGSQLSVGGLQPGELSTTNIDRYDVMTVDIVLPGDGAEGLKVLFIGSRR